MHVQGDIQNTFYDVRVSKRQVTKQRLLRLTYAFQ